MTSTSLADFFLDDSASHESLLTMAREIAEEVTRKPATLAVHLFPKIHAMVVEEGRRCFHKLHIRIYVTASTPTTQPRASSYAQMVVVYHRLFQSKVADVFRALQSCSKAIAHPNAQVEEMERWLKEKQRLEKEQDTLMADCLIYAATMSYFVAFPAPHRLRLIAQCRKLCEDNHLAPGHADQFDLSCCLTSPNVEAPDKPAATSFQHLPCEDSDWRLTTVAIKALAGSSSERWPFVLDPTGVARDWLVASHRDHGVQAIALQEGPVQCVRALASAAAQGLAVVLTGCGASLPPHCLPFLDRSRLSTGKVALPFNIPLAGTDTAIGDVHPNFLLFMLSDEDDPGAMPASMFQLVNPVLATPSVSALKAWVLPSLLALDDPSVANAHQQCRLEELLLTALIDNTEAQCRSSLFDKFALPPLRRTYAMLLGRLDACHQHRQALDLALAPYRAAAEALARLFLAVFHSPSRCPLPRFLELLHPVLGLRNGHPAGGDGEEDAVRMQTLPQTIASVVTKHFKEHFLLEWALSVPLWQTREEEGEEAMQTVTLPRCLQWWPPSQTAARGAPVHVADVAALLQLLPVDVTPSGEGLAAVRRIVQAQVQVLRKRPSDVRGFVLLVETLQQMTQRLPFYLESLRKAHARLCIAVAKAPGTVSPEEQQEAEDVAQLAGEILAVKPEAELFIQSRTPAMLQHLQEDALALMARMDDAKEKVGGADAEAAVVAMHEIKAEIEWLETQFKALAGDFLHPAMAAIMLCRCRSDELSDTFASVA
eukprot:GGOE01000613.1.p1 GENE.GGOE01000613.1~~GGOE01000613.1.p1  ORF type:complete len:769 (+),score=210.43 GGOE01000613.1:88-2394(+)